MAMSLATLEILEEAQFPPLQARAIARVFEAEAASYRAEQATKADLADLRRATQADIAALRSDLTGTITGAITGVEARMEVKIERAKMEGMRWTLLVMIGQMSLLAGIMYFLLQNTR
jgi:hypothetical protein